MDSLQVVETKTLLEKKLGIQVPTEILFEDYTLFGLIDYLNSLTNHNTKEPVHSTAQIQSNSKEPEQTQGERAIQSNISALEQLSASIQERLQNKYKPTKNILDRAHQFKLIDSQVTSSHLLSMGAREIDREKFIHELEQYCPLENDIQLWQTEPVNVKNCYYNDE